MPVGFLQATSAGYTAAATVPLTKTPVTVEFAVSSPNSCLAQVGKLDNAGNPYWDQNEIILQPGSGGYSGIYGFRVRTYQTQTSVLCSAFYPDDGTPLGFTPGSSSFTSGTVNPGGGGVSPKQITLLTAASGTFTTLSTTTVILIRGVGAGGGGAGAGTNAYCAGGGSGGYAEKLFVVASSTGYAYTCGAGSAGADGTDSTFTVGAVTVTAKGGIRGLNSANGSPGGLGGAAGTNGDVNLPGAPGGPGFGVAGAIGVGGWGGNSLLGPGAQAVVLSGATTQNGNDAPTGYGGGGGGSYRQAGVNTNGGKGAGGCWIVLEFG